MSNLRIARIIPEADANELFYLESITDGLSDEQIKDFAHIYRAKRKDPQTILIMTLLGFLVIAGLQRFALNQIGMGILYLLTGGLCLVGTIIDLINYRKMTLDFNEKMMQEAVSIVMSEPY